MIVSTKVSTVNGKIMTKVSTVYGNITGYPYRLQLYYVVCHTDIMKIWSALKAFFKVTHLSIGVSLFLVLICLFLLSNQNQKIRYLSQTQVQQRDLIQNLQTQLNNQLSQSQQSKTQNEIDFSQQLISLRQQLNKRTKQDVLGVSGGGSAVGILTINPGSFERVEIYEEPQASSPVIAWGKESEPYFFTDIKGKWYHIELGDGLYGWIEEQFVQLMP